MTARIKQRLGREEGFTLIELLVVVIIIGILMAIAIPSYLGFRDRANQRAASADVRSAIPDTLLYYQDVNPNSYKAMTATLLQSKYDSGLKLGTGGANADGVYVGASDQTYCLWATISNQTSYFVGPAGTAPSGGTTGVQEIGTAALPAACSAP